MKLCLITNNVNYISLLMLLISFVFTSTSYAYNDKDYRRDVRALSHDIKSEILELRDVLYKTASNDDKELIDSIKFSVPSDPAPVRVRSIFDEKKPKIEISTGFVVVLHQMSRALAIENLFKKPSLGAQYTKYAAKKFSSELGREKFLLPEEFARVRLDNSSIRKVEHFANGLKAVVLLHVISHEIGHIALDHKIFPHGKTKRAILKESRKNEKAADAWASQFLVKGGHPPLGGLYAFLYWHYVDEEAIKLERYRSHPAEITRMESLVHESVVAIDKWWSKDMARSGMSKQTMKTQLVTLGKAIKKEIVESR